MRLTNQRSFRAIAGLDAIRAASLGRLDSVLLINRKPVAALKSSKYVLDRGLNLDLVQEDTALFDGSAEEAARTFPATTNVAAALRLAIPPAVPVQVRVVAVPGETPTKPALPVATRLRANPKATLERHSLRSRTARFSRLTQ